MYPKDILTTIFSYLYIEDIPEDYWNIITHVKFYNDFIEPVFNLKSRKLILHQFKNGSDIWISEILKISSQKILYIYPERYCISILFKFNL